MNDTQLQTLEQVRQFLKDTHQIEFSIHDKADRYAFIQRSLIRFGYNSLKRNDKGLLLRFLAHVSSYSYVQVGSAWWPVILKMAAFDDASRSLYGPLKLNLPTRIADYWYWPVPTSFMAHYPVRPPK